MNETLKKIVNCFICGIVSASYVLPFWSTPVLADALSNEQALTWVVNNPVSYSKIIYGGKEYRFRLGNSNNTLDVVTPSSVVTSPNTLYAFNYKAYNNDSWSTCFYTFSETSFSYPRLMVDTTGDRINFTYFNNYSLGSNYTYSGVDSSGNPITGRTIWYYSGTQYYMKEYMPDDCPRISLKNGQNLQTILGVISSGDYSVLPWNMSTSSGGMHFEDGTELDSSNTNKYSQIFTVMDNNHDNTITEAEVYYYNSTYNTNYDYSNINEGNDFNSVEFLYWVATEIDNGNENPGGGSGDGSGGGSGAIEGGITVTDSFTQTQTQTIEENAVNVIVNNNNALTQENYQELNSLINNYNGSSEDETDPFQQAIGNFQAFHAIALAFAGLASVVFGWLPWWVTALLGAMFSMVCVFIVLRLIHLFK